MITRKHILLFIVLSSILISITRAFPTGIVFSDNLRIRDKPGLGGTVTGTLGTNALVPLYSVTGSGSFSNGVWDMWYRISPTSEQWINAAYVARLPFVVTVNGTPQTIIGAQERLGETWLLPGTLNFNFLDEDNTSAQTPLGNPFPARHLLRDNPEIRLSLLCRTPFSDITPRGGGHALFAHPKDFVQNDYTRITYSEGRSHHEQMVVYEINTDTPLPFQWLYGIALGDSVQVLRQKIGIESLPARLRIPGQGAGYLQIELSGTDVLTGVRWTFQMPYNAEW